MSYHTDAAGAKNGMYNIININALNLSAGITLFRILGK